ncbi:MAG: LysM peptidoglycan-binding domain-containing protein [Actinobacteria bacterium]|nr:LysM peptidoglycan-binding domain-containing protein [Actinomycetota bacterium]MCG2803232.1 LysM peptidoglycan-binding domain-containing protein [Cellulomonas sp.]
MRHHLGPDRPVARLISSLALGALGLGLGAALGARTAQLAVAVRSPGAVPGVDVLVELGVVAIGAVLAGWLGLSAAIAAGCLVARAGGHVWRAGERLVTRHGPAVVRRTLTVTVAAGFGLGSALGAHAAPATAASTAAAVVVADPGDLGWPITDPTPNPSGWTVPTATPTGVPVGEPAAPPMTPARVTTAATPGLPATSEVHAPAVGAPAEPAPPQSARGAATQVVVQPGDTLWDIARRSLPPGAGQAQIAAAWPAWYEANRQTIGADPDLIHPGQVLLAPAEGA